MPRGDVAEGRQGSSEKNRCKKRNNSINRKKDYYENN